MPMYYYFFILFFLSGIISFIFNNKHFLLMLLSLEFVVLSLFVCLFSNLAYFDFEYFLSMLFLSMSVCEGALGLSLLVLMSRAQGCDKILLLDNLW